ncbi:hypothetical protein F5Y00DRAFT_265937 [Daldinia vernicosa]|uniref:uncharacterized protein n=1 Tax=Daldinia vernicosa TaxID=114800 RepID=UPI00200794DE|nr:uncharacterized protein F5Y00DRAFT_265937 [Daldinia vernicosa]KAI0845084.1 hypothetical protein F5Y00DRAFT_265937 [Daldinia vernicosa]
MSAPPVLLFLGAGKKLGTLVPAIFAEAGYKIAVVARTPKEEFEKRGYYQVQADFNNPESIPEVFAKVRENVGIPTVVVYNAVQYTLDDPEDPFASLAPENVSRFHSAVAVNGTTPLIAIEHAVQAFRALPPGTLGKSFIFTGNVLNHSQFKNRLCFGVGKTVAAYGVRYASVAYAKEGFKFYYADERSEEGLPVMREIDGLVAGKEYLKIAEAPEQLPWLYTYTTESGYKDFGEKDYLKTVDTNESRFLKGGR